MHPLNLFLCPYWLSEETDVNVQGFENTTALLVAAHKKHFKSIQILLENKADPNIADNLKVTPLFAGRHEKLPNTLQSIIIHCNVLASIF